MISKTIGYNGVHNIFRQTHVFQLADVSFFKETIAPPRPAPTSRQAEKAPEKVPEKSRKKAQVRHGKSMGQSQINYGESVPTSPRYGKTIKTPGLGFIMTHYDSSIFIIIHIDDFHIFFIYIYISYGFEASRCFGTETPSPVGGLH